MSGYAILYKFQPAALKDPNVVGIRVLNVMKKYEKLLMKEFKGVTQHWAHPVAFTSNMRYAGGDVTVDVTTDDDIYYYISHGTGVRYATMKPGFVRKTNPGTLATSAGSGPSADWVSFVSREKPHKGIDAREFERLVREKYEDQFFKDIHRAIKEGLRARK